MNDYLIAESRTSNSSKFNTTQVFILSAGDWTEQVRKEFVAQTQRRNIWVKGLYVSPHTMNLVMLATGIGITSKILVWFTR